MKKMLFLFILFILITNSCDKADYFYVENRTDALIYYLFSSEYPDTIIPTNRDIMPIKAHSVHDNVILTSWERNFSKCFPKDTMFIFFFDANTIEKNDWDVVRRDYMILERRMYSKQDIIKSNWRIVYP